MARDTGLLSAEQKGSYGEMAAACELFRKECVNQLDTLFSNIITGIEDVAAGVLVAIIKFLYNLNGIPGYLYGKKCQSPI